MLILFDNGTPRGIARALDLLQLVRIGPG